jgi:hypothetical protein
MCKPFLAGDTKALLKESSLVKFHYSSSILCGKSVQLLSRLSSDQSCLCESKCQEVVLVYRRRLATLQGRPHLINDNIFRTGDFSFHFGRQSCHRLSDPFVCRSFHHPLNHFFQHFLLLQAVLVVWFLPFFCLSKTFLNFKLI